MSDSPVCVDASFLIRLLESGDPDTPVVRLWVKWHRAGRSLVAPTLLYYEIANALHRYTVHGELLPQEATDMLDIALRLDIALYGDAAMHHRALQLAAHLSLPAAYDAHYLALAERLGAELWTADRPPAETVQGELPWVHLL
ncbi:MAG: PIN domain-containing protein [Chloroflexi bacterium]|nr:MAG: PIN domain-containing protein [Chloroflexota bacterium]